MKNDQRNLLFLITRYGKRTCHDLWLWTDYPRPEISRILDELQLKKFISFDEVTNAKGVVREITILPRGKAWCNIRRKEEEAQKQAELEEMLQAEEEAELEMTYNRLARHGLVTRS